MQTLLSTPVFDKWLKGLKDKQGKARILTRLQRLEMGNAGDCKSLGGELFELRMTFGPGYRVYFTQRGIEIVILLAGGDKSTQKSDIEKARKLAGEL